MQLHGKEYTGKINSRQVRKTGFLLKPETIALQKHFFEEKAPRRLNYIERKYYPRFFDKSNAVIGSLYLNNELFIIYNEPTPFSWKNLLGLKTDPGYKVAQNASNGEWVLLRPLDLFPEEATKILVKLNRIQLLQGQCSIETLCAGKNAAVFFDKHTLHEKQYKVACSVLKELQNLDNFDIKLGDLNFHHFVYNDRTEQANIINFEGTYTLESWVEVGMGTPAEFSQLKAENKKVIEGLEEFINNKFGTYVESFDELVFPLDEGNPEIQIF